MEEAVHPLGELLLPFVHLSEKAFFSSLRGRMTQNVYFEEMRVFQAGKCLEYVSME